MPRRLPSNASPEQVTSTAALPPNNVVSSHSINVVPNDEASTAQNGILENGVEQQQDKKATILRWFLLGFSAAILLTTISAGTSMYFLCRNHVTTMESAACSQKKTKRRGLSRFFQRKKNDDEECSISPSNPKACACQWMWDSVQGYIGSFGGLAAAKSVSTRQQHSEATSSSIQPRPKEDFPTAFTPESLSVSVEQEDIMKRYAQRAHDNIDDWDYRVTQVPWGGMMHHNASHTVWWAPARAPSSKTTPLETLQGGNLLYSYLRIMKWPTDLETVLFPFKPCKKHGCPAEFALNHTLVYRERYQPWLVTPSVKTVNKNGLVYHHGFSPSHTKDEHAPHAIVWLRPALRVHVDEVFYARTLIRELEHAVASSMHNSGGRVGKFNVVVSGQGFSLGVMPSLNGIKVFVTMLQDHYVDRLGVVVLTDMGRTCELLLKCFLPLIAEEVRNKIIVVPHNHDERAAILETILGAENIPVWLGGSDKYEFDADTYYSSGTVISGTDEQAREYLTTLPYHA